MLWGRSLRSFQSFHLWCVYHDLYNFFQLQDVVPDLTQLTLTDISPEVIEGSNDEVYIGLPTFINAGRLVAPLEQCAESLCLLSMSSIKSVRPLLTKMELAATLANTYNLTRIECRIWNVMFSVSEQSGRFLDASYALVNRLLAELMRDEFSIDSDYETLKPKAATHCTELLKNKALLDTAFEAALIGQLPTPHAHFQSVFIALGTTYLEHYFDWPGFSARMALIPLRYKDFFASKSWAAVCARGYFYWMHLHARCLFGATNEIHSNLETLDTFLTGWNNAIIPVPDCILHAAVIVRMHGRTLVQFMRQCCEQKLAKQHSKANERTDENKENIPVGSPPHKLNAPKVATWGGSQLTGQCSFSHVVMSSFYDCGVRSVLILFISVSIYRGY
ncbi:hypothetical protein P879_08416 [Paragonimus westermani]|uniref:Uncharacterized protein n=1 Tax=Paragonimus westermani TaxID=34504 RepID=A0A8T0DF75_9TREM|nr:hypothetical protein P879_08416 [Paragonimus westermani]